MRDGSVLFKCHIDTIAYGQSFFYISALRQQNVKQAVGDGTLQGIVQKPVVMRADDTVADKGNAQPVAGQVVGRQLLIQQQPRAGTKARFGAQPVGTLTGIVALLEQQEG